MREDTETHQRGAPRKVAARLKLALGAGVVVVASFAVVPFAAASVPSTAKAPARAVATAVVTSAVQPTYWVPVPLWPHWGGPVDGSHAGAHVVPTLTWPHWGNPLDSQVVAASARTPVFSWPHWGGPVR